MSEEKKKEHDLKWELRQLRLRLEDDEMHIKELKEDLKNAKKTVIDIMMANQIALQVLNNIVDDVKKLKEEKK